MRYLLRFRPKMESPDRVAISNLTSAHYPTVTPQTHPSIPHHTHPHTLPEKVPQQPRDPSLTSRFPLICYVRTCTCLHNLFLVFFSTKNTSNQHSCRLQDLRQLKAVIQPCSQVLRDKGSNVSDIVNTKSKGRNPHFRLDSWVHCFFAVQEGDLLLAIQRTTYRTRQITENNCP